MSSSARSTPLPNSDGPKFVTVDAQPLINTVNEQHYGSVPPPDRPRRNTKRRRPSISFFGIAMFVFIAGLVVGYGIQTPLDSFFRQHTRAAWAREVKNHDAVQERWEAWIANMEVEKRTWNADRSARQEQDHLDDIERRRTMKAEQDRWDADRRRRQEQDRIDNRARQEQDRLEEEERARKERKAREEHERQRGDIEWQSLERRGCVRYETADYTATLSHVPLGFDPIEECLNKPLMINGRRVLPSLCEDEGYCGKMTGHWEIDFNEPMCTPFFGEVQDKGCIGAHRRYDARLENIQEWDSWKLVCSTMSAAYGDVKLGPGASCSECNGGRCGYWATWMIKDYSCVA
ncbi:hypothetical protein HYPSUDRAFT_205211 [Hypholoma sublateritium FD-334 SS-4]|uniref:Uncharacterized protein n=1 Tax=Hypholoma sublateritium (strain FD-334 SS-4) TaxID=945553 RepID=A0A0D2M6E1_HYPSF|nr:hypothetical protein HYPSUDRAFT_205211 [Hypholoma sublateritium FD-334 SS-4]